MMLHCSVLPFKCHLLSLLTQTHAKSLKESLLSDLSEDLSLTACFFPMRDAAGKAGGLHVIDIINTVDTVDLVYSVDIVHSPHS